MEDFQIYILQVNAGLVVFYLLYRMLFSRDTFLRIRRLFLFSIVILAFVYPLISLASWLEQGNALPGMVVGYAEMLAVVTPVAPQPAAEQSLFTWQRFLIWIWSGGSLVLTLRMAVQLAGICRFAYQGKKQSCHHVPVIALPKITAPFSFFGWIFVNPAHYEERELHEIIVYESAHVRQWHSLDMLLGEILCIFFWFNPVVWLLRKEIRQNLEFLADEQVVNSGYNRKNYQYHLLRLSHQSTAVPIVNNFNVSQLKKRIIMMNKKKTSRIGLLKYAFLLPVTGLLILAGNARAVTDLASHTLIQAGGETSLYKGRVVDEQGNPLQGATVIIKGTSLGASTDQDGEFSIQAGKGNGPRRDCGGKHHHVRGSFCCRAEWKDLERRCADGCDGSRHHGRETNREPDPDVPSRAPDSRGDYLGNGCEAPANLLQVYGKVQRTNRRRNGSADRRQHCIADGV